MTVRKYAEEMMRGEERRGEGGLRLSRSGAWLDPRSPSYFFLAADKKKEARHLTEFTYEEDSPNSPPFAEN